MSLATNIVPEADQAGHPERLHTFVVDFERLLSRTSEESAILREGAVLLAELIREDNWLPDRYAQPAKDRYSQYLLYADDAERFSVVSFVWGPGQTTPIHDHTTWGLIGMLRGSEMEQHYTRQANGSITPDGEPHQLQLGAVDAVSPRIGDLHRVSNLYDDRTSISIHVYGGNIGKTQRAVYEMDGSSKAFVSGYTNLQSANISDLPKHSSREGH